MIPFGEPSELIDGKPNCTTPPRRVRKDSSSFRFFSVKYSAYFLLSSRMDLLLRQALCVEDESFLDALTFAPLESHLSTIKRQRVSSATWEAGLQKSPYNME